MLSREAPEQVLVEVFITMVDNRNFTQISGGVIGALNTGGVQIVESIDQTIGQLLNVGADDLGKALKALTEEISSSTLSEQQRNELLEQVEELGRQAILPAEQRRKGIIKPLVDSLAGVCSGAGGLAAVWQMWGPTIAKFFGL